MKNIVIIQGNLTRDPEMRYSPKGDAVAHLSLAINESWEGKDGQRKEVTNFIDVTFFGQMAEKVAEKYKKGNAVYVQGRLKTDSWEDKQTGQKRSKLVVIGAIVTSPFAGQPSLPESRPAPAPKPVAKPATPQPAPQSFDSGDDDGVPF